MHKNRIVAVNLQIIRKFHVVFEDSTAQKADTKAQLSMRFMTKNQAFILSRFLTSFNMVRTVQECPMYAANACRVTMYHPNKANWTSILWITVWRPLVVDRRSEGSFPISILGGSQQSSSKGEHRFVLIQFVAADLSKAPVSCLTSLNLQRPQWRLYARYFRDSVFKSLLLSDSSAYWYTTK